MPKRPCSSSEQVSVIRGLNPEPPFKVIPKTGYNDVQTDLADKETRINWSITFKVVICIKCGLTMTQVHQV